MERLTKKYSNGYGGFEYIAHPNKEIPMQLKILKAFEKLGKLEDLEEQIGMPLEDYLNIIKNHPFVYCIWKKREIREYQITSADLNAFRLYSPLHKEKSMYLLIKELEKRGFLSREEAEKKLEEMKNEKSNCRI